MKTPILATALISTLLLTASVTPAQMSYPTSDSGVALKSFRGLTVKGNVHVILVSDTLNRLVMVRLNDDAESVHPRIANRSLYLVRERESNDDPVTIYVFCRELKAVETYGSARVTNEGLIESKNVYLYVHESGEINLTLNAEKVAANVRKNGNILITGDLDQTAISVRGKGNVRLKNLDRGYQSTSVRSAVVKD